MWKRLALAALLFTGTGFTPKEKQPVTAKLVTEHTSIHPGGTTRVGVHFEIEDGWHMYGEKPGDAGLPTKVAWAGPPKTQFGPLQYPPAHEFVDPGDIHTFGYSGSAVLFSTMTVAQEEKDVILITAYVSWLACKDVCVPGKAELDLALPVSIGPQMPSTSAESFFKPQAQPQAPH